QLIIFEITDILEPESRAVAWRVCLRLMVFNLHVVTPFLLAFAFLGEVGFGRYSLPRGSLLGTLLFSPDIMPPMIAFFSGTPLSAPPILPPPPPTPFQACLARVGIVGVVILGALSGFGAVNLPFQQLSMLLRKVPESLIKARERRMCQTLSMIGQRKRRATLLREANRACDGGQWAGRGAGDWRLWSNGRGRGG
ncbi:unnamed protein product, partial [Discosporangium mesarthrocarpum]